jgi:hypothetical protein
MRLGRNDSFDPVRDTSPQFTPQRPTFCHQDPLGSNLAHVPRTFFTPLQNKVTFRRISAPFRHYLLLTSIVQSKRTPHSDRHTTGFGDSLSPHETADCAQLRRTDPAPHRTRHTKARRTCKDRISRPARFHASSGHNVSSSHHVNGGRP